MASHIAFSGYGIILSEKEVKNYYKKLKEWETGEAFTGKITIKKIMDEYDFCDPDSFLFCIKGFYGIAYAICDNGQILYEHVRGLDGFNEGVSAKEEKRLNHIYKESVIEYLEENLFIIPWVVRPNPLRTSYKNVDEFIETIISKDEKEAFLPKDFDLRPRLYWITGYH